MTVLQGLKQPESLILQLKTLIPIHTGGIGQYGEQLHPSGLLGSIRSFSCLLAAAIGNQDFESDVWGHTSIENQSQSHAKRVALSWDVSDLKTIDLPDKITWQDATHQHKGWFFNVAQEGKIKLTLTKRGISDENWQLLLIALRIQILHATFGAKDQFGLGVVKEVDNLHEVPRLNKEIVTEALTNTPNLRNAFFAEIHFSGSAPNSLREYLEAGLHWRAHLRNSFRKSGERDLRHYLFGALNEYGSAINVSAVYPLNDKESALRVWGVLPHTTSPKIKFNRNTILNRIKKALDTGPQTPSRPKRIDWEVCPKNNIANWINELANLQRKRKVIKGRNSQ